MTTSTPSWLLLIVSLPSGSATARMRIWRALKAAGCGALRDGAYLLPHDEARHVLLAALAAETEREGGSAWLMTVLPDAAGEQAAYRALFDREQDYAALLEVFAQTTPALAALGPQEASRMLRKLRKEFDAVKAIDYFPGAASARAETAWLEFQQLAQALGQREPLAIQGTIALLDRAGYQARVWATRRRPWVDRIASAWLVKRFIDPAAQFLWLEAPPQCPGHALGFDFDGADFTHVGERVTFEVLAASFDLDHDTALQRLGLLVRSLDVGGVFVPEAAGFEAMLKGASQRIANDDQLLAEVSPILDSLYAHFSATSQGDPV